VQLDFNDGEARHANIAFYADDLAIYGKHNLQYGTVIQMPKSWWKAFPPFRRKTLE
jgi:hypothetical protein